MASRGPDPAPDSATVCLVGVTAFPPTPRKPLCQPEEPEPGSSKATRAAPPSWPSGSLQPQVFPLKLRTTRTSLQGGPEHSTTFRNASYDLRCFRRLCSQVRGSSRGRGLGCLSQLPAPVASQASAHFKGFCHLLREFGEAKARAVISLTRQRPQDGRIR